MRGVCIHARILPQNVQIEPGDGCAFLSGDGWTYGIAVKLDGTIHAREPAAGVGQRRPSGRLRAHHESRDGRGRFATGGGEHSARRVGTSLAISEKACCWRCTEVAPVPRRTTATNPVAAACDGAEEPGAQVERHNVSRLSM